MSKLSSQSGQSDGLPFIVTHKLPSLIILAAIIFVIALGAWWKNVYNSPRNVFEGMLKNNLSTQSITRHTYQEGNGSTNDRIDRISFVPNVGINSIADVKQTAEGAENEVVTETVGTLADDFSRYTEIKTNQKGANGKTLNYDSVKNIWSKSSQPGQAQNYSQSVIGLMVFANLDGQTRNDVLKKIHDKNVYDVQYGNVQPMRLRDKSALVFQVKVKLVDYVPVIKQVAKQLGLGDTASINADNYKDQPPVEFKVTVDKQSRQIMEIEYSGGQKEEYLAYGISQPVETPANAISLQDLQQKIQAVQ